MLSSFRLELHHWVCVIGISYFLSFPDNNEFFLMVPVLTLVAFYFSAIPSCVLLSTLLMFCLMPEPEGGPCYQTCSMPCLHAEPFCQVLSKAIKSMTLIKSIHTICKTMSVEVENTCLSSPCMDTVRTFRWLKEEIGRFSYCHKFLLLRCCAEVPKFHNSHHK